MFLTLRWSCLDIVFFPCHFRITFLSEKGLNGLSPGRLHMVSAVPAQTKGTVNLTGLVSLWSRGLRLKRREGERRNPRGGKVERGHRHRVRKRHRLWSQRKTLRLHTLWFHYCGSTGLRQAWEAEQRINRCLVPVCQRGGWHQTSEMSAGQIFLIITSDWSCSSPVLLLSFYRFVSLIHFIN